MSSSNLEQAIYVDLAASTTVGAKVGDRIYWLLADDTTTLPYCTYSVISDVHEPQSFDASDTGQARVQFNVIDDDKFDAWTAAKAVWDRLDKYGVTMDGITIYSLNCSGIRVIPIPGEENRFQATFDALVRYKDA